ncbi:hypothetical protein [Ferroplasma sp.]|uniref:hypothetical protein n=1 Tax=Ferroplasma sp. TaxID=2591003 RepID=UPI00261D6BE5|nr:hypothetical protein [Ferroplasma sp.]
MNHIINRSRNVLLQINHGLIGTMIKRRRKRTILYSHDIIYPLADRSEMDLTGYCFMRTCIPKVGLLSMRNIAPPGGGKLMP